VNAIDLLTVDLFSRSAATIFGLLLFIATTSSLLRTIVVPRTLTSLIADTLSHGITGFYRFIARHRKTYEKQDSILAWNGPMIIVLQLVTWLILYFISYGLWIYGIGGVDFTNAFREAGSSLFTLGFAGTSNFGPTVLAFMAAATGPIVIALLIGFLPTIYGAYIDREVDISLLGVSGGQPSWGPEFLARLTLNNHIGDLPARMNSWTKWFGNLRLTHTTYPVLVQIRSSTPYRHWVVASITVMDAASMQLALTKTLPRSECSQVIIHGTQTLESLYAALFVRKKFLRSLPFVGQFFGAPNPKVRNLEDVADYNRGAIAVEEAATADSARGFSADAVRLMSQGEKGVARISKDDFTNAVKMLERAGYPVEVDLDTAWTQFTSIRARYEYVAYQLAYSLDVVPAPWSGPRRKNFDTIWPTSSVEVFEDGLKDSDPTNEAP